MGRGRPIRVLGNWNTGSACRTLITTDIPTAELAQVLPPIHLDLTSDQESFRISLYPEDYPGIGPFATNPVIRIGARFRGPFSIATSALRNIAVHVDNRNCRIGFAEPAEEL